MFDRLFFHWRPRLVNHLWPFGGIMQSTKEAGHIVTNYGERLTTSPREILIEIQLRDPSLYRVRVFDVWASMLELLSLRVVFWIHWLDFKIRELQINVTKERSEYESMNCNVVAVTEGSEMLSIDEGLCTIQERSWSVETSNFQWRIALESTTTLSSGLDWLIADHLRYVIAGDTSCRCVNWSVSLSLAVVNGEQKKLMTDWGSMIDESILRIFE